MPWTEISTMDARLCFVAACLRHEAPFHETCARAGISRKTSYKWQARYRDLGAAGLSDRSCAPATTPHGLGDADPGAASAAAELGAAQALGETGNGASRPGLARGQHRGRSAVTRRSGYATQAPQACGGGSSGAGGPPCSQRELVGRLQGMVSHQPTACPTGRRHGATARRWWPGRIPRTTSCARSIRTATCSGETSRFICPRRSPVNRSRSPSATMATGPSGSVPSTSPHSRYESGLLGRSRLARSGQPGTS